MCHLFEVRLHSWFIGDTLYKSGALAFMEDKMRNFSLYKLRDSPLPSKANPSNEVIRELQECFKDVLSLCDELNDDFIELYSMRIMATQLLHYLSSGEVRAKDMLAAMRKFRAGKWEQLWNEARFPLR